MRTRFVFKYNCKTAYNRQSNWIDIWQAEDQSGNTIAATFANAKAEGVQDKIEIKTTDMRAMPFEKAKENAGPTGYVYLEISEASPVSSHCEGDRKL
jgi:hypothetical protein